MIKDFSNKKIGYVPLSHSLKEPGDRRRFCFYARERNIKFEIANPTSYYDLVYLTFNCNIPKWIKFKEENPQSQLIFELVDSYLFENNSFKSRVRGLGKYLTGSSSKFYTDYKDALYEISKIADAVVCSTAEQQQILEKYNHNVHISLDFFGDDIKSIKSEFKTGEKLKLVWEGQPYTIDNILSIAPVLNALKDKIELHLVTDIYYYKYAKRFLKKGTQKILSSVHCVKFFYEWTPDNLSKVINECDLAIIPINLDNKMAAGKPENKLILFWQSAMPTITSNTPAYGRTMNAAGLELFCTAEDDWFKKLHWYQSLVEDHKKILSQRVFNFAQTQYSKDELLRKWDLLFESV